MDPFLYKTNLQLFEDCESSIFSLKTWSPEVISSPQPPLVNHHPHLWHLGSLWPKQEKAIYLFLESIFPAKQSPNSHECCFAFKYIILFRGLTDKIIHKASLVNYTHKALWTINSIASKFSLIFLRKIPSVANVRRPFSRFVLLKFNYALFNHTFVMFPGSL